VGSFGANAAAGAAASLAQELGAHLERDRRCFHPSPPHQQLARPRYCEPFNSVSGRRVLIESEPLTARLSIPSPCPLCLGRTLGTKPELPNHPITSRATIERPAVYWARTLVYDDVKTTSRLVSLS
jgi:hypothetical protein